MEAAEFSGWLKIAYETTGCCNARTEWESRRTYCSRTISPLQQVREEEPNRQQSQDTTNG